MQWTKDWSPDSVGDPAIARKHMNGGNALDRGPKIDVARKHPAIASSIGAAPKKRRGR